MTLSPAFKKIQILTKVKENYRTLNKLASFTFCARSACVHILSLIIFFCGTGLGVPGPPCLRLRLVALLFIHCS
jgi:hypothetical protein